MKGPKREGEYDDRDREDQQEQCRQHRAGVARGRAVRVAVVGAASEPAEQRGRQDDDGDRRDDGEDADEHDGLHVFR